MWRMWMAAGAGLAVAGAVFVLGNLYAPIEIDRFYDDKLRVALFSGFLSLSGFLLSLKTFIIVKMKEGVYERASYRKLFEEKKKLKPRQKLTDPLRLLKRFLFWSILGSLITAVAQMTIGLWDLLAYKMVALGLCGFTLACLTVCLFEINGNLNQWLDDLDDSPAPTDDATSPTGTPPAAPG